MQKQTGFTHLLVILLVLTIAVVGFGGYSVYNTQNNKDQESAEKASEQADTSQAIVIQQQPVDSQDDIAVPAETVEANPTSQTSTTAPAAEEVAESPSPRYARVSLINGSYFDVPLNKGGSGDGYFSIECTKGGPGSEDDRPIINVDTVQGEKRVEICKHYVFPTYSPKSNTSRLTLADGLYIDTSLNKGGGSEGYQPASCKGGDGDGTPFPVIQVQTEVDVRNLELCPYHALPSETVY